MPDPAHGGVSRRTFLKAVGAAGLVAGCSPEPAPQKLVPYLVPPEHIVPGMPLFYRTVCRECTAGCGVTARTREGRVVKLEGNPEDPIGRGALCGRGQAALQRLYAPERIRGPMRRAPDGTFAAVGWDEAMTTLVQALEKARTGGAAGIRLVSRPEPGSNAVVQRAFMTALGAKPGQRVVVDPFDPAPLRAAGSLLYGRAELPAYTLDQARSVVAFGADFVETWVSPVELARGLAQGRGRVGRERTTMTWIGPRLSLTGVSADVWLPARPGTEPLLALALLRWLCDPAHGVADLAPEAGALLPVLTGAEAPEVERACGIDAGALERLGRELAERRPSAVLGPGPMSAGPDAMRLAAAVLLINHVLGNVGRTVQYGLDPDLDPPSSYAALQALTREMAAGRIALLLLHQADPAGTLPAALGFKEAAAGVPMVVSFSDQLDASTRQAHLILPDDHPLESFGDVSPRRGIVSFCQPVMNPLWDTRSASQVMIEAMGKLSGATPFPSPDLYTLVRSRMEPLLPGRSGDDLAAAQREAQERGGIYSEVKPEPVTLRLPPAELLKSEAPAEPAPGSLPLVVFPTALRGDGRAPDLPWLQEVPDAVTTISWKSWAELSPATARRLGVADEDVIEITAAAGKVSLPIYVYPGLRDEAVAIPLGGPEALALLPSSVDARSGALAWIGATVTAGRTGRRSLLPRLEGVPKQEGREIVRTVSTAAPVLTRPGPAPELYPPPAHPKHRWAMVIDQDRCTGCQACVVACYAENNVPVNGPELAAQGRNMAWLRVERYLDEEDGRLTPNLLLMLCQQCTNAPCEPVCPVYATYHSSEGLNVQVYNRCVGTRYCSNNCPYKVRTFNWRDPAFAAPLDYQLNPDVSVRSKGVMEKCTFCSQRIRAAELAAEKEKRDLKDGEITPACAQTCPTQAIVFGDAVDPQSRVSQLRRQGRAYRVLEELNTEPAITYLARVREKQA